MTVKKPARNEDEAQPMTRQEAEEHMKHAEGWTLVNDTIQKNYKFSNFKQAVEFINKVADISEAENHHPDILLWSWNNVKITISTHRVKGLTENDFILASKIDQIGL